MKPVNSQDEFTAVIQDSLEHLALENARMLAAQITAMVVYIQTGQRPNAVLFFEKADIPENWLALSEAPLMAEWAVFIPEGAPSERWTRDEAAEYFTLPSGDTVVLSAD